MFAQDRAHAQAATQPFIHNYSVCGRLNFGLNQETNWAIRRQSIFRILGIVVFLIVKNSSGLRSTWCSAATQPIFSPGDTLILWVRDPV